MTRTGQDSFAKLKILAIPKSLNDLSLEQIFATVRQYYKRKTVEIAEQFKFFKCVELDTEGVAEYIAEYSKLGKTCNFGKYLDTVLCDIIVCGLKDYKIQEEMLCIQDLTLALAVEKARAAEAVNREICHFPAVDQHTPCMPLLTVAVRRRGLTLTNCPYTNFKDPHR